MANNINWGKIYETTWWGIGVTTNTISWGKSYLDLAGVNILADRFSDRVIADGGTIEALSCVSDATFMDNNWTYYFRVVDDGGVVESLECVII